MKYKTDFKLREYASFDSSIIKIGRTVRAVGLIKFLVTERQRVPAHP